MKVNLNCNGQQLIKKFDDGIDELRRFIVAGNIAGISANLENVGAAGMKLIETTTNSTCLKNVFEKLANWDHEKAIEIAKLKSINEAETILCKLLNDKAQEITKCL